MTYALRPASPGDAPAIAALHAANWRSAYTGILRPEYLAGSIDADRLTVWRGRLAAPSPAQRIIVAEGGDGRILGFACFYRGHDPQWGGFLDNLHAAAEARGTGVGKALLRAAASEAEAGGDRGLYLWVFDKNRPARGFYAHMGGCEVESILSEDVNSAGELRWRVYWADAAALARGR